MAESSTNEQLTITQVGASEKFGISDRTVRRWEKAGLIKGKRVRGVKLYPLAALKEIAGLR